MHIARLVPSRPLGGRACVSGYQLSVSAIRLLAFAVGILLSTPPLATHGATGRRSSESDTPSGGYSTPSRKYDCSVGGTIGKDKFGRDKFGREGINQGVDEALKILDKCPSCHDSYRGRDPIKRLNWLVSTKRIIVTDKIPARWDAIGPPNKWLVATLQPWPEGYIAVSLDLNAAKLRGQYDKPCVYVNSAAFLAIETAYLGDGTRGLTLAQARALVVLHELSHVTDVIPKDNLGVSKNDKMLVAWKSLQNTLCVRRNCLPDSKVCPDRSTPCVHPPFPGSEPKPKSPEATPRKVVQERK